EAGQNLTSQIASDPQLLQTTDTDLAAFLGRQLQSVPYFSQLALFDLQTNAVVVTYPPELAFQLTPDEETGTLLTSQGIPNQMYAIPPDGNGSARISFPASLAHTTRLLDRRTDMNSNPYMRSLINNLSSLQEVN